MSNLGPEPRINSRNLSKFINQTVRLTCKIVQVKGDMATVEASDGGQVGVLLSRDMHMADPFVEIIGTVKEDNTVKALTSINLGKTLDMKAVDQVVELANSSKGSGVFT
ncbi:replication factor A protein 3 [Dioszegia hungarica]|uniref:Replication factor A protein 3 n=1 Tax=Dioszegia hungarica TaxID=4972 RepID=A0AA38HCY0_9TREE|nr:replication factor A protein 3 [Dioszegia hungarica]KAI9638275.1 replication factor A protein 3 [Dioszegia hungarica]